MILITGASGKTGKAIIKSLSKTESVRAFIRGEEHAPVLRSLGAAEVILGDLLDESAVRSAMQGMDSVYHICPNMHPDEVTVGRLMLDEAKKADVEHFVYHSVLHPQTEKMQHHWGKMRVEEMIFESGIAFTVLQPAPYMQNLLAGWKSIVDEGVLHVPYSVESMFSFIDLNDLAEAVKVVITEEGHRNAVYELAGTGPTSHGDVAEIISDLLKRNVYAKKEEIEDWRFRAKGLGAYADDNLIKMFEYYDQWGLVGNQNVLKWILKREPTSLELFINRIAKENNANN